MVVSSKKTIGLKIRKIAERIRKAFNPEQVILFGSHARGDNVPDSDVDILVVMSFSDSKREAAVRVGSAVSDIRIPKDIIVTSPEEFKWRKEVAGTIERPASLEGIVLYARK